jgi:hypothetical protein
MLRFHDRAVTACTTRRGVSDHLILGGVEYAPRRVTSARGSASVRHVQPAVRPFRRDRSCGRGRPTPCCCCPGCRCPRAAGGRPQPAPQRKGRPGCGCRRRTERAVVAVRPNARRDSADVGARGILGRLSRLGARRRARLQTAGAALGRPQVPAGVGQPAAEGRRSERSDSRARSAPGRVGCGRHRTGRTIHRRHRTSLVRSRLERSAATGDHALARHDAAAPRVGRRPQPARSRARLTDRLGGPRSSADLPVLATSGAVGSHPRLGHRPR